MDVPKDKEEDKDEDKDKGKGVDEDEDQVAAATCARSQTSMRFSPRLATARPRRTTHIRRLQLVVTRSERAIHLWLTLYLIVSRSQCLGDE